MRRMRTNAQLQLVEFSTPESGQTEFQAIIETCVRTFAENLMCDKIKSKKVTLIHYHRLLKTIFHQTLNGPSYLAIAGANCSFAHQHIKEYLIHHAEEEKSHWKWILDDLRVTGYKGADPRTEFPTPACSAYIAFNYFIANKYPIGRMGIAIMLETVASRVGGPLAADLVRQIKIPKEGASFFLSHAETDVGHTEALEAVLEKEVLSSAEWGWMCHCAETAFFLYREMYNEVIRLSE